MSWEGQRTRHSADGARRTVCGGQHTEHRQECLCHVRRIGLVGEEAGLGGGGHGGFAAGDADDAEDGEFAEGGAGDEDAVGAGVEVGRGDVEAVVEEAEEVVGDDAFEGVAVDEAEADPETVEFRTAEEGFALGLEVIGKFADEIDRADLGERDFFVLAIGCEQVDRVGNT